MKLLGRSEGRDSVIVLLRLRSAMSTIVDIELPSEEFSLESSLAGSPDVEFEIVRVAAHGEGEVVPYVRVAGADLDALHDAIRADDTVADAVLLDDFGDERLYRMRWGDRVEVLTHVLNRAGGTILEMHGSGDRWYLRVLYPDRDALSATHEFCRREGLTFTVTRISDLGESVGGSEFGLTHRQYEVLVTAAREGYFDVPRALTMADLAEELGVSQQALSERLRRGHETLIDGALRVDRTAISREEG